MHGVWYVKQLSELGVNHHGSDTSILETSKNFMSVFICQGIWP